MPDPAAPARCLSFEIRPADLLLCRQPVFELTAVRAAHVFPDLVRAFAHGLLATLPSKHSSLRRWDSVAKSSSVASVMGMSAPFCRSSACLFAIATAKRCAYRAAFYQSTL